MAFYTSLMDKIPAYTGLSPAAFFTILAMMVAVYLLVCGMFVDPEELKKHEKNLNPVASFPAPNPVELGDMTEEELMTYNGSDSTKPLLMAIKGQIYDVTMSRMFYGPGGPYAMFAGRDASRALALMSFDPKDLTGNIEGLDPSELEVLQDWEYKFMEKYKKVGNLITKKASAEDSTNGDEKDASKEDQAREIQDLSQDLNSSAETQAGKM
ncbi:PREDICTED: membrane steroid-binding protein 2-like [Nelumbo nucifera]|uniref:Cytochrome b5 heme-binding domain-containing protein n=2 Tax=Nelumbo nucifera TaxID=4432 RepID=A0A822ZY44_NELNU|nr:PREDICTED: membrane steroid-binding protein 2-like [Nelumbo nucifera]DAD48275.1 TPA_asm: hypothetical protein HUJ06_018212 [Nelumbo nucifera]